MNTHFAGQRNQFDFTGKKVAFIKGEGGHTITTKSEFFQDVRTTSMKLLSDKEKGDSGGYDVLVFNCTKIFTTRHQRMIFKRLRGDK
ncbi:MAG: hypothetical protein JWO32_726 [Bacteroidetes bacterium]|nr:hypothetical protein [Bacteroidota bacterium]